MIYKRSSVSTELEDYIIQLYVKKKSLDEIVKLTNVNKNTLLNVLDYKNCDFTRDEMTSFKTYGDSILVIADTHIGSKDENFKYIDEAYNTGIKVGVSSCIHLGDIVQGKVWAKGEKPISYQMDYLKNDYPAIDDFNTYLLLGNHDYTVFEYYPEYMEILENVKGLYPLGYKRAYFNWNDYLFGMDHKVNQIKEHIILENVALYFIGHGHGLKVKSETKLKASTLSDDIIDKNSGAYPAFIIAHMNGENFYVDVYDFINNKANLKKENYFNKRLIKSYKVK